MKIGPTMHDVESQELERRWWEVLSWGPSDLDTQDNDSLRISTPTLPWTLRFSEAGVQRAYEQRKEQLVRDYASILLVPHTIVLIACILSATKLHETNTGLPLGGWPMVLLDGALWVLRCRGKSAGLRQKAGAVHLYFNFLLLAGLWIIWIRLRVTDGGMWVISTVSDLLVSNPCSLCLAGGIVSRPLSSCFVYLTARGGPHGSLLISRCYIYTSSLRIALSGLYHSFLPPFSRSSPSYATTYRAADRVAKGRGQVYLAC